MLSLYAHIPFCLRRCPYCDFFSTTRREVIPAYMDALITELSLRSPERYACLATLYLGGGTPSLVPAEELERLFAALRSRFRFSKDFEATIEINPATADPEELEGFLSAGCNRFSLGVQSFSDRFLRILERPSTAAQSTELITAAAALGVENINVDLMFGLPGQTMGEWKGSLRELIEIHPAHASIYALTLSNQSGFRRRYEHELPGEDMIAEMFMLADEMLAEAGYRHYETSNYARDGYLCRHNMAYWRDGDYLGLGAGAHSSLGGVRSWNPPDLDTYLAALRDGKSPVRIEDFPAPQSLIAEKVMLGLRLDSGIHLPTFERRYGVDLSERFGGEIRFLEGRGFLKITPTRIFLTKQGKLFADEIIQYFL